MVIPMSKFSWNTNQQTTCKNPSPTESKLKEIRFANNQHVNGFLYVFMRAIWASLPWRHQQRAVLRLISLAVVLMGMLFTTMQASTPYVVSAKPNVATSNEATREIFDTPSKEQSSEANVAERMGAQNTTVIAPTFWTPSEPAYKIGVKADGLYALTYSDLRDAGLPVDTLDPTKLRMFYLGREMAIQVEGEGDGRFDPDDMLLFYGRSIDSLYNSGELPEHKYTDTNIYWLDYDVAAGRRPAPKNGVPSGTPVDAFLQTVHMERQTQYLSQVPKYNSGAKFRPDDDHWYWYLLQFIGVGTAQRDFTFSIVNPSSKNFTGRVSARVVGRTEGIHGLRLYLNDEKVYENRTTWKNFEAFTGSTQVSQSKFVSGGKVRVQAFNVDPQVSQANIDWVEIAYYRNLIADGKQLIFTGKSSAGPWRYMIQNFNRPDILLYDVTDLHNLQRINNAAISGTGPYTLEFGDIPKDRKYIAVTPDAYRTPVSIELATHQSSNYTPSTVWVSQNMTTGWSLLDTNNGADWIVITHRDFWTATLPLVDYRAGEFRVAMVDVEEIYNQFNGGMLSSESIRDFLEYAYHNWQSPPPKYVLMAGGGTNDMRGYGSNIKKTYVPTFIYPSDPIEGDTSADNRFVTFVGNDILPDMHLGRFPAYAVEEIQAIVSKTLRYEATPTFNDWNTNILLIADDLEGGGGNFYEFSDIIAHGSANPSDPENTKFMPAPYTAEKIYLGQTCDLNNPSQSVECRADIENYINNEGALIVSYVGHAQTANWGVEKLMDINLASTLNNMDKLSIFLGMACFEGFFHEAPVNKRSLSESYIFNPNGGAVASWSPTGFGVATGHDYLEQGLFLSLFQEGETRLGAAMTDGKYYLNDNAPPHKYDDLIDTFTLLGDPALTVQRYVEPTVVEMAAFDVTSAGSSFFIDWTTVSEIEILGFNVLRSTEADGPFVQINSDTIWSTNPGHGSGDTYHFYDQNVEAKQTYWYKLEVLSLSGGREDTALVEARLTQADRNIFLPLVVR